MWDLGPLTRDWSCWKADPQLLDHWGSPLTSSFYKLLLLPLDNEIMIMIKDNEERLIPEAKETLFIESIKPYGSFLLHVMKVSVNGIINI